MAQRHCGRLTARIYRLRITPACPSGRLNWSSTGKPADYGRDGTGSRTARAMTNPPGIS